MTSESVLAHAKLINSVPAANETIRIAPKEVVLHFMEKLEISMSKLEVKNSQTGEIVSEGSTTQLANDKASLRVALKPLGNQNSSYDVSWKAASMNTHKMPGHFTFTYDPQEK